MASVSWVDSSHFAFNALGPCKASSFCLMLLNSCSLLVLSSSYCFCNFAISSACSRGGGLPVKKLAASFRNCSCGEVPGSFAIVFFYVFPQKFYYSEFCLDLWVNFKLKIFNKIN